MSFYIGLSFLSNGRAGVGALRAEGRRVLRELDRTAGFRAPHDGTPDILTEPGGRPYFSDRRADFSVSHSRMIAAVVYFSPGQNAAAFRTGCDIQYVDPERPREEIVRNFFSSPEQDYVFSAVKAERSLRFCHIWTLKECFLKIRGLSIFDIQKTPVFAAGGGNKLLLPQTVYLYELGTPPAYVLAVSLEAGGETAFPEPRVCWFSEDALPVKSMADTYAAVSPEKTARPNI